MTNPDSALFAKIIEAVRMHCPPLNTPEIDSRKRVKEFEPMFEQLADILYVCLQEPTSEFRQFFRGIDCCLSALSYPNSPFVQTDTSGKTKLVKHVASVFSTILVTQEARSAHFQEDVIKGVSKTMEPPHFVTPQIISWYAEKEKEHECEQERLELLAHVGEVSGWVKPRVM